MKEVKNLSELKFIKHGFYNALDTQQDLNPILMIQVHSADCLFLTERPEGRPSVDALITRTPNLNITVYTADCAPILLADSESKMIAAIHAGWRGAFQGVIERTVLEMVRRGANLNTIRAGIGPHIQQSSFEMTADMKKLFPTTEEKFFTNKGEKLFFDFDSYIQHRLKEMGITSVCSVGDDTVPDENYHSFRRNQTKLRQYSSIMIKEEK